MVLFAPACPGSERVVLGYEHYPPYQLVTPQGVTGLDIDLVRAVFERLPGYELELREMPWKRHLIELEAGRVDLAAGALRTPEREAFAYFSATCREDIISCFVGRDALERIPASLEAIVAEPTIALGIVRGYAYGPAFERLRDNGAIRCRLVEVGSIDALVGMVASRRVDVILADLYSGSYAIRSHDAGERIVVHPARVASGTVHVMASRRSLAPEFITAFDRALAELREDGSHAAILQRWVVQP